MEGSFDSAVTEENIPEASTEAIDSNACTDKKKGGKAPRRGTIKKPKESRPYKKLDDATLKNRIMVMKNKTKFLKNKVDELETRCDAHVRELTFREENE